MGGSDDCPMQGAQGDILEDSVVLAAKAHAASIRRTMWVKENKRLYGSKGRAAGSRPVDDDNEAAGNRSKLSGGREREPPIIDGPIYSPAYWRAWQTRARVKSSRKPRTRERDQQQTIASRGASNDASSIPVKKLPQEAYTRPTSSFAGGKKRSSMFCSAPEGDSLLRAHHEKTIRPLLERAIAADRRRNGSSRGALFTNDDPRKQYNARKAITDAMYDIQRADGVVLPASVSYSFRAGKSSGSESAIQGISRDTPGAVYDPKVGGTGPTTRLYSSDRFHSGSKAFVTPGPGAYPVEKVATGDGDFNGKIRAVAWNGPETFTESPWGRSVRPPHLRDWQGFGNGCSLEDHVNYGACLDGKCCTRHSIEKRNALRLMQFTGNRRAPASGRRHPRQRHILGQPSQRGKYGDDESSDGKETPDREKSFGDKENPDGMSKARGQVTTCGEGYSGQKGGSGAKDNRLGGIEQAIRKKRPLHFASENGELSLVSRLCDQGDDRNAVDERGRTPLHVAAEKGLTRIVDRLLEDVEDPKNNSTRPVADVNAQDDLGRTALFLACLRGHERVVRALLTAGADPDLVDIRGTPPQEAAEQHKTYQLLQFKTDISLVKSHLAHLEAREMVEERRCQESGQSSAGNELSALSREEERLKAAVRDLEKRREDLRSR